MFFLLPASCFLLLFFLVPPPRYSPRAWSPVTTTGSSTPEAVVASPGVAVGRTVTGTGTADIDITSSGFGTPMAALVIFVGSITDGTAANHRRWGIGCADGTDQWMLTTMAEDGLSGSADSYRLATTTETVVALDLNGDVEGRAVFEAFIPDGVRLSVTDAFPASYFVTALLFKDITNFNCITFSAPTTQDASTPVAVGFQPDMVWLATLASNVEATTVNTATLGMGMALPSGAQFTWSLNEQDALSPMDVDGVYHNLYAMIFQNNAGGPQGALELSAFTATGFTATTRLSNTNAQCGAGCKIYGAAFEWPDGFSHALAYATPPSTGAAATETITFPGFQPDVAIGLMSLISSATTAGSTDVTDSDSGGVSILTPSVQYSNVFISDDGATESAAYSLSDNQAVHIPFGSAWRRCLAGLGRLAALPQPGGRWTMPIPPRTPSALSGMR